MIEYGCRTYREIGIKEHDGAIQESHVVSGHGRCLAVVDDQTDAGKNSVQAEFHPDGRQQAADPQHSPPCRQRFVDRAARREAVVRRAGNIVQPSGNHQEQDQPQRRPADREPGPTIGGSHGQGQTDDRGRPELVLPAHCHEQDRRHDPRAAEPVDAARHGLVGWALARLQEAG